MSFRKGLENREMFPPQFLREMQSWQQFSHSFLSNSFAEKVVYHISLMELPY